MAVIVDFPVTFAVLVVYNVLLIDKECAVQQEPLTEGIHPD
jgi:hypothetical protein